MKILIVDDDQDILALLRAALEVFGYQDIHTAESGQHAIAQLNETRSPFDLFLLDIQMPGVTGLDLCFEIRSRPDYQYTPIIMVTAMSDQKHIDAVFAAGATDYITKPFQFDDIKHRIRLAERAAFSAEQLAKNAIAISEENQGFANVPKIDIGDPIPIDDVDGVVRVFAFENYLSQLSRLDFSRTRFEILKVTNIEAIHARCISREFADQVTDIAECISDALRRHAPMIAYFGRGIYAIAMPGRGAVDIKEMSAKIHEQIETTGLVYRDGTPVPVVFELIDIGKRTFLSPKSQVDYVKRIVRELTFSAQSEAALLSRA